MKILLVIELIALTAAAAWKHDWFTLAAGVLIPAVALVRVLLAWKKERRTAIVDVAVVLESFLLLWQLTTSNRALLDPVLFPTPEAVLRLFFRELKDMLHGMFSSLYLLGVAYALSLATAIPGGLVVGSSPRLRNAAEPFSKVLSAIPPIVYIPYAIALLPSFKAASIFVIWSGAFWPVFVSTIAGIVNIPETLLDSARMLHLGKRTFILRILLPGAMPSILTGASLGLVFSFLLLTAAELIGATEGLGWYVKNFSDFADYARVVVGIIFIGIVITAVSAAVKRIEKRILRYKETVQ
ncbi:MAG: ABC transporter permease subunit, partial [Lentisphaeria bacterium]|nr:ABC transporter permease subunit [Lentisphaeria bacterium]